jgi:hypothetical protein
MPPLSAAIGGNKRKYFILQIHISTPCIPFSCGIRGRGIYPHKKTIKNNQVECQTHSLLVYTPSKNIKNNDIEVHLFLFSGVYPLPQNIKTIFHKSKKALLPTFLLPLPCHVP